MAQKRKGRCLTCDSRAKVRGLCATCWSAAYYRIHRKKDVTEAQLVELGLMLPPYTVPQSEFGDMLAQTLARKRRTGKCNVQRSA
jgi:hypothetical protein